MVSLVSVETGKVIAKTGKAPVKNGSCFWSDPVFESTFLSWDIDGKSSDKKLYKLVVSMVIFLAKFMPLEIKLNVVVYIA